MKKVVLITGASSGFGKLIAQQLHKKGYRVFGTSRNPKKIEVDFEMIKLDVNDKSSIEQCIQEVLIKADRIDILINNAGAYNNGYFEEETDKQSRQMFETLFWGASETMKQVLPIMREQKSGHIINITSVAGLMPAPGAAMYSAAKHALEGLTKSIDYEVRQFGIKMSLVEPGNFKTDINKSATITESKIDDYNKSRLSLLRRHQNLVEQEGLDPKILADGVIKVIENKKLKIRNIIGNFARVVPVAMVFSSLVDKTIKKEFPFLFEN